MAEAMCRCSAEDENPAMHEGATRCGRGSGDPGLCAGERSNDTSRAFSFQGPGAALHRQAAHPRTIAQAEIETCKESGRSAFAAQKVVSRG